MAADTDQPPRRPRVRRHKRGEERLVRYGEPPPRRVLDLLQWTAVAIGAVLLIHGLVVVVRAGFDSFDLFDPIVAVGGLQATRLLGILEVICGLVCLYGAAGEVDEGGLRVFGVILAVIGIVMIIEPNTLHRYLGVTRDHGMVLTGLGVALALMTWTPTVGFYPPPRGEEPAPWQISRR